MKIKVGILGATGSVGQRFIQLLEGHPWFEVNYVAASPRSAGKTYQEAVSGRWLMSTPIPEEVKNLTVQNAGKIEAAIDKCSLIFSAVNMPKDEIRKLEKAYAKEGFAVLSNNSAHRHTDNVPVLIPEVNPSHADIIQQQRKDYGWDKGLLAVKPNCSVQSYVTPVYALMEQGYKISEMIVTTLQALSGAGYPGPSSLDMIDNIVPYIGGEEKKSEIEPQKILGKIEDGKFVYNQNIKISAHCNRVPVIDGHTACVSMKFDGDKPEQDEILEIWKNFKGEPQKMELPMAPLQPIIYEEENDRPQPRKDRNNDKGMAVTVGRLRPGNVFDYRFVGLSHNTIRGAAGGGILNAEYLVKSGFIKK
ncbi:MAG TPA: aspartate-semialdehyde dehydrogenase [bacterium]|nr:aspartate-semialdehyde dehydrogenase [bacterium]